MLLLWWLWLPQYFKLIICLIFIPHSYSESPYLFKGYLAQKEGDLLPTCYMFERTGNFVLWIPNKKKQQERANARRSEGRKQTVRMRRRDSSGKHKGRDRQQGDCEEAISHVYAVHWRPLLALGNFIFFWRLFLLPDVKGTVFQG